MKDKMRGEVPPSIAVRRNSLTSDRSIGLISPGRYRYKYRYRYSYTYRYRYRYRSMYMYMCMYR